MGTLRPQPKLLTIWRIRLTLAMALPAFVNTLLFFGRGQTWLLLTAIWLLCYLLLYLVYFPIRFNNLSFSVSEKQVVLHSGVFYRFTRAIPLQNVQFTNIRRGPFEYLYGMGSLIVVVAGGRAVLPGLRLQDAQALSRVCCRME